MRYRFLALVAADMFSFIVAVVDAVVDADEVVFSGGVNCKYRTADDVRKSWRPFTGMRFTNSVNHRKAFEMKIASSPHIVIKSRKYSDDCLLS